MKHWILNLEEKESIFTIEQKINLLNDSANQDNKVTKVSLATNYMIDESSVCGIIKSEDQIRESYAQMDQMHRIEVN